MDNEIEKNVSAAAENGSASAEEASTPAAEEHCCADGVCSFEAPAEEKAEEPAEEKAEQPAAEEHCCADGVCSFEAPAEEKAEEPAEEDAEKESRAERPVIPVTQEMLDDVRGKLAMMLDYLGLDATVKAEAGNSKINLIVASDDAGRIIGRKGSTLENFQLLINRMMQKNDVNYPKIYIDIDGYASGSKRGPHADSEHAQREGGKRESGGRRERGDRGERGERGERRERRERKPRGNGGDSFDSHDENLRMLALDSAKEVRRWGDPKTLPEMNAHDRRIIHLTLEKEADITTDSVGEEPHKAVVISLKK